MTKTTTKPPRTRYHVARIGGNTRKLAQDFERGM